MDASAQRTPQAEGSLFDTPLCHLALYLYRHGHSGTLRIAASAGEVVLRVQRGRITAARLPWPAERLLDGVLPLCGLREGSFAFFEDDLLARDEALAGVIDPYELLTASLHEHARDDMVEAVLQRFSGKPLRLAQGRDLERLRLQPAQRPLIELIRAAPASAEELIAQAPMPAQAARRLLYALLATNMVTPHVDREAPAFRSQVEPRAAGPTSNKPQAAGAGAAAWQRLASLRPLGSLGPPRPTSTPPGGTPQPSSAQSHVSMRPASLAPQGDDKASRQRRAELLLQRGRADEALTEVEALLTDEPESAELLALRAHALFEKHQAQAEGLPRAVVDAVKKALDADAEQPRALYTKALMFKRGGDTKKALAYFKRVLQIDPKHIEAAREVRLAKLRND